MTKIPSFNACIEDAIKTFWNLDALTDYKGATLQYQDVARKIEKLHINELFFKGLKKDETSKFRFTKIFVAKAIIKLATNKMKGILITQLDSRK